MDTRILIIIPTFNEKENIGKLIDQLMELYPHIEILVVDDSSSLETADAVREAEQRHEGKVHLNHREGGKGRGSAVLEGFQFAMQSGYDLVFEMDADMSHDPKDVARFIDKAKECDIVVGSRYMSGGEVHDWGWKRTILSWCANKYARFILGIPISDYTNGFRCYTKRALAMLNIGAIQSKGYIVLSEIAYQLHKKNARIGEVPIIFVNRREGVSCMGFHELYEGVFSVLRLRFRSQK